MKLNYYKIFKKLWPEAKKIYVDRDRFEEVIRQSMAKSSEKSVFSAIRGELTLLFQLCQDFVRGRYRKIHKKKVLLVLAGLLYLLNPLDIVPDFLLGIGFLDDLTVFTYILTSLKGELDHYEQWKLQQRR